MTESMIARTEYSSYLETELKQASSAQIEVWHQAAVRVAQGYRRCEYRLVELLKNMSECQGYYKYECDSLTRYARFCLNLPENTIRDFVTVANKAKEIPEIVEALKENKATVSKLRKVCSVITRENYKDWLSLVEECTTREIERAVARENPEAVVQERATFVGPDLIELRAGIPEDVLEMIEKIQDWVCTTQNKSAGLGETLRAMAEVTLEKIDPVFKAERAQKRQLAKEKESPKTKKPKPQQKGKNLSAEKVDASRDESETKSSKRKPITAAEVHAVQLRDQNRCTHLLPNGRRCANRRWLHLHHIKPVASGGSNAVENLELVCSSHHRMRHRGSLV